MPKGGTAKGYKPKNVRLPPMLGALIKTTAFVRNVPENTLIVDMLSGMFHFITDFDHPYFSRKALGFGAEGIELPPERYPGYLASIGFAPADGSAVPPPRTTHEDAMPVEEDDLQFVDVEPLDAI